MSDHFSLRLPCGARFAASRGGAEFLRVERDGETVRVWMHTRWLCEKTRFGANPAFDFTLEGEGEGIVEFVWEEHSARLYIAGILRDEEWPLGALPDEPWEIDADEYELAPVSPAPPAPETVFTGPMQFYRPSGRNTGVGDCMPFARDGRYCLYYLFDRRGHCSKHGLGAHQWAQISSPDLKTWTIHPLAVPITDQAEASICTGSLIQKDGLTYAFYAIRTSDGSPALLSASVSRDGVRFEKTKLAVSLSAPYEPVSARDPMVFFGADGQYHMLVTTELVGRGARNGCLAHLTSPDLETWSQREPFIVPGYEDQPECSDYFEWGGTYYLVFSNYATARYRVSKRPFGPWRKPENDLLDAVELAVEKTAAFGNRRLVTGFLNRLPRGYAGNAVTHELIRRADGTLASKFVPEILPKPIRALDMPGEAILDAGGGFDDMPLFDADNFRFRARVEGKAAQYGLLLHRADGEYRISFDPAARTVTLLRPKQHFNGCEARNQLENVALEGGATVDLLVQGDILDLALGCGRILTARLADKSKTDASLFAFAGTCALTDARAQETEASL